LSNTILLIQILMMLWKNPKTGSVAWSWMRFLTKWKVTVIIWTVLSTISCLLRQKKN